MQKLLIAGKTIKYGFGIGAIVAVAKLLITYYYGYRNVDASYGGPFFYYWSTMYVDGPVSKSTYTPNKLFEQRKSDMFSRYVDMVQTNGRKDSGVYPYYAYGLPDTFVLTPKKTWTIFKTKEQMDLEFSFLEMRGEFISKLYNIDFDANSPYFKDSKAPAGASEEEKTKRKALAGKPLSKERYFKPLGAASIRSFFASQSNGVGAAASAFETIVKNVMSKKSGYGVEFKDNKAKMTPEFEKDVMALVSKAFGTVSVNVDDVNAFFFRLATITPTPMDVHIVNRIKLFFLYTNSYLDAASIKNEKFNSYKAIVDELSAEKKNGALDETKERRFKNFVGRMQALRTELILNKASAIIASVLGNKGPILVDDKRNFLEAFGNPAAAKKGKIDDKEAFDAFDSQIKAHYGI